MLEPIKHWRVHIGLHRTATTNLQDTLALVREQLFENGIDFPTRAMLRENKVVETYLESKRMTDWLPDFYHLRKLRASLAPIRSGPTCLLFSDEKWVGKVRDIMRQPIYPKLDKYIARLVRGTGRENLSLFLSIREYSSVFTSAYSQSVKMGNRFEDGFFARALKNMLSHPPSWVDLVRRIKVAAPEIPLRIWTFEDYVRDPQPILEAYTGITLPHWPKLEAPERSRGISAETIEKILAVDRTLIKKARKVAIRKVAMSDNGITKFNPISNEDKIRLKAKYAEDLQSIERETPGIFIR